MNEGTCPGCGMPGGATLCDDCHEYGPPCRTCEGRGHVTVEVPYREYYGSAIQVTTDTVPCPDCQD